MCGTREKRNDVDCCIMSYFGLVSGWNDQRHSCVCPGINSQLDWALSSLPSPSVPFPSQIHFHIDSERLSFAVAHCRTDAVSARCRACAIVKNKDFRYGQRRLHNLYFIDEIIMVI